jgi:hypothetical protein
MNHDRQLTWKIKQQIRKFSDRLSEGLNRPQRRFVGEMVYGIQAAQDVKVSNMARSLNESIALIKTENRLCRNLADVDLTDWINRRLCWEGAGRVDAETVLALDLSDLRKDYAKRMEHLAGVRDGSKGETAKGYWLCEVVAAHPYGEAITPLYGELYSQAAEDFDSENAQLLKAVHTVNQATGGLGIWTVDRGGDRRALLLPFIDEKRLFVIRQKGDRDILLPSGSKRPVAEAAQWCSVSLKRDVTVEREGQRVVHHLRLGSLAVRLPERPDVPLWLVVIRGFGQEPILLLTNVPPSPDRNHAGWIADLYLTRWKCEETFRYLKQSYNLEDVRVRSYVALRNLYALVHAVAYFVSVVMGTKSKLNLVFKKVCEKAKRFYEIAVFFQYAVAEGIHRVLFGSRSGPNIAASKPESPQLLFAFAQPPN